MQRSIHILYIFVGLSCSAALAQTPSRPSLGVGVRSTADSVTLRWVPTTPVAWEWLIQYGVLVKRKTLESANSSKVIAETLLNNGRVIKPLLQTEMERIAQQDSTLAVLASMMYGNGELKLSGTNADGMNAQNAKEMRLFVSMMLAQQDVRFANYLGLRWVDKTIDAKAYYQYEVVPQVPASKGALPLQKIKASALTPSTLPKPPVLRSIVFADSAASMVYRHRPDDDITGYFVERSTDGQRFERITKVPLLPSVNQRTRAIDTLSQFNNRVAQLRQKYYYRLRGLDSFGELTGFSNVVEIYAHAPLKVPATDLDTKLENGKIALTWAFPDSLTQDVLGFEVSKASSGNGKFDPLHTILLPPNTRRFVDTKPQESNYYQVIAYDYGKQAVASHTVWLNILDTIPPSPPNRLKGTIDKQGNVRLSWNRSPEKDVKGYKIYETLFKGYPKTLINEIPLADTVFKTKLPMHVSNRDIFYEVVALDNLFNHSKPSEELFLQKPDVIPPQPPVLRPAVSTPQGVALSWLHLDTADVQRGEVYRQNLPDTTARRLFSYSKPLLQESFTDTSVVAGRQYRYYALSYDAAGLRSLRSNSVSISPEKTEEVPTLPLLDKIAAEYDTISRTLTIRWEYPAPKAVESVFFYRQNTNGKLLQQGAVAGNPGIYREVLDDLRPCQYFLLVNFRDGSQTPLSREVPIPLSPFQTPKR
jgi:uncharacterized protein